MNPVSYGQKIPNAVLLVNTSGSDGRTLEIKGATGSGKFAVAVSCTGSTAPLSVKESNGKILERISACSTNGTVIYGSKGPLRATDTSVTVQANPATHWRLAAWKISAGQ
ncbi:hypothetical protein [Streptantibioticus silvisoli]|uniref:Ricin B lectin domain-containing protein n=1 Tax=Streptantibioticus silvisoli TaxID=2705255 RepID=A0ABT6W935_9ACTN|nr:hypothetical protein [Streptantibioticus silvisoli]MDI5966183.1 hypothetical protein [Streptantibioticus silvisoli]